MRLFSSVVLILTALCSTTLLAQEKTEDQKPVKKVGILTLITNKDTTYKEIEVGGITRLYKRGKLTNVWLIDILNFFTTKTGSALGLFQISNNIGAGITFDLPINDESPYAYSFGLEGRYYPFNTSPESTLEGLYGSFNASYALPNSSNKSLGMSYAITSNAQLGYLIVLGENMVFDISGGYSFGAIAGNTPESKKDDFAGGFIARIMIGAAF